MSDPASTWNSPEVVLPQLLEKAVMSVQPLLVYAWEHVKKTNKFLSNCKSNRFLLWTDNNAIIPRQSDEFMTIIQL